MTPEAKEEIRQRRAYYVSIAHLEPYSITVHYTQGWAQYKGLKFTRKRGWWKDCGLHELARKMVALGLSDAPVKVFNQDGMHTLTYASLFWVAEHDITETDLGGIFYYKHAGTDPRFEEDDE